MSGGKLDSYDENFASCLLSTLHPPRPLQGEQQDLLFFMTARYHLAVVSYNSTSGDLVTRAYGDVKV